MLLQGIFKPCVLCSEIDISSELFCESCFIQLAKHLSVKSRKIKHDGDHRYLMDWSENRLALSRLVRFQKGEAKKKSLYEALFSTVSQEELKDFFNEASLVPCPSKKKGAKDHAYQLAEYLSAKHKRPLVQALTIDRNFGGKQSLQVREKRFERSFQSTVELKGKIIFIDDVVTTGASFAAAVKALKKTQQIQCFSLFYRKLREDGYR